jgi:hypothetical protein
MKQYNENTNGSFNNGEQHRAANGSANNGKRHRTTTFIPGQRIPASGTYRVIHAHPMRPEVNLLQGRFFPRCGQCIRVLEFELIRAVPFESAQNRFRLLMQES